MPLKRDFVINRQGKDFVLYAGLLDLAHDSGLQSIETTLVQIPTEANGNTAIASATVRLADPDGNVRSFAAVGDANPGNVNRLVANALIRMAETRAKARALRDAVNVTAELMDEATETGAELHLDAPTPQRASYSVQEAATAQAAADSGGKANNVRTINDARRARDTHDEATITAAALPATITQAQAYARVLYRNIKARGLIPPEPPDAQTADLTAWRNYCDTLRAASPQTKAN